MQEQLEQVTKAAPVPTLMEPAHFMATAPINVTSEAHSAQRKLPVWASALMILAICGASLWLALNPEGVMRLGYWGYGGAFLISMVASATILLPAPGIVVIIAMRPSLDPVILGIVAGVGSAVGELTGYLAGASGRAFVPEKQRLQFEQLHRLTNRYGALLLFVLAAIPFPLFDFVGIISGILRMNAVRFLVAVAFRVAPQNSVESRGSAPEAPRRPAVLPVNDELPHNCPASRLGLKQGLL